MARLTPPQPDITLYETGFGDHDKLGRKQSGDKLSDLVERISEPMVIALDGGWGSGKSFFLRCWVGEHLKAEQHTAKTVYFDAFAHDFVDAPLVSLLTCLTERFEENATPEEKATIGKLKDLTNKIGPAGTRLLAALSTQLAKKYLGDENDEIADIFGDEFGKSAPEFWKQAAEQHDAMQQFSEALSTLTKGPDGTPQKLVIVIDELDRCRPDYALSLLEIIKHFFAVDHVHFVLGVNLRELENSVRARYGAGIDAQLYLQKFVTLTMSLPKSDIGRDQANWITYFEKLAESISISGDRISICTMILKHSQRDISLRSIDRLAANIQLSNIPYSSGFPDDEEERLLIASLVVLKTLVPEVYSKAKDGTLIIDDLSEVFGFALKSSLNETQYGEKLRQVWANALHTESSLGIGDAQVRTSTQITRSKKRQFQRIVQNNVETFSLPK